MDVSRDRLPPPRPGRQRSMSTDGGTSPRLASVVDANSLSPAVAALGRALSPENFTKADQERVSRSKSPSLNSISVPDRPSRPPRPPSAYAVAPSLPTRDTSRSPSPQKVSATTPESGKEDLSLGGSPQTQTQSRTPPMPAKRGPPPARPDAPSAPPRRGTHAGDTPSPKSAFRILGTSGERPLKPTTAPHKPTRRVPTAMSKTSSSERLAKLPPPPAPRLRKMTLPFHKQRPLLISRRNLNDLQGIHSYPRISLSERESARCEWLREGTRRRTRPHL